MRNVLIGLGVVVVLVLARMLSVLIPAAGTFADLQSQLPASCEALTIAPGTEDVTVDAATGLAFVSTDDRRGGARGGIYAFNIHDTASLHLVSTDAPADFHPHGISLWTGPDGAQRLFVVNHRADHIDPADAHAIEIFDVGANGMLSHVESVQYADLTSPNDVVAVGAREFYATNDRAYHDGMMATLEAYFALPLSGISHFDGSTGRIAADGIAYANGINISADGTQVYVSELLLRRIRFYERDVASGDLSFTHAVNVPTAPDNIEVDSDENLWTGGHPRVLDFVAHATDENEIAPSHVVRLNLQTREASTVLMSLDGELNASSVASYHEGVLIVGAVFDDQVLVCPGI
jgi:arylesterase/paraoxonase